MLATKFNSINIALALVILFIIQYCGDFVNCTLSKKKSSGKKDKKIAVESSGPANKDVYARGLVQKSTKAADVLQHHSSYSKKVGVRNFPGEVLGYVTPWNSGGYDVAKTFGKKFAYISPVWLQIKRYSGGRFNMEGGHDIDQGWIRDVKKQNPDVQFVPRVLFEGWSLNDFHVLLRSQDVMYELIDYVIGFIETHKFDGLTLEVWMQFGGEMRSDLTSFVTELGQAMINRQLKLILVIPPPLYTADSAGLFSRDDFDVLLPVVEAFSVMTYDYPHHGSAGAVAPYDWVKACVMAIAPNAGDSRKKILVGMNFYGMNYKSNGGAPLVGKTYREILAEYSPKITWMSEDKEHRTEYKDGKVRHVVYYPSLQSIHERIELAKSLGTGLAIWDIGQGLDYFYDLF